MQMPLAHARQPGFALLTVHELHASKANESESVGREPGEFVAVLCGSGPGTLLKRSLHGLFVEEVEVWLKAESRS